MIDGRSIKWSNLLLIIGIPIAGLLLIVSSVKVLAWTWAHAWIVPLGVVLGIAGYLIYTGKLGLPEEINFPSAPRVKGKDGTGAGGTILGWTKWLWSLLTWPFRKLRWILVVAGLVIAFAGGTVFGLGISGIKEFSIVDLLNINIPFIGQAVEPGEVVALGGIPHITIAPVPDGIEEVVVEELGGKSILGRKVGGTTWLLGRYGSNAAPTREELNGLPAVEAPAEAPKSDPAPGWLDRLREVDWPWK